MDSFSLINSYAGKKIPFIFIIDFDSLKPVVIPLDEVNPEEILYDFNGRTNCATPVLTAAENVIREIKPVSIERYREAFNYIRKSQAEGDSYLANLTFPSEIKLNISLKDLFHLSRAKYRLWYKDIFTVFSPEIFVQVNNGIISSFPMKGTIDADIPGAEEAIMNDRKEAAEHLTIVDLIRNDLSIVAADVKVKKYRYIDRITTAGKNLLQVSSEITGTLKPYYLENTGDMLKKLLPAGSVTGAPKNRTVEIIKTAEQYNRGWYCGVCGYCDGNLLDSGVMIRYVEKHEELYYFKSGGGITVYSDLHSEYREMVDKVNVPVN